MSEFKAGEQYRVLEGATFIYGTPVGIDAGSIVTIREGVDGDVVDQDGDVRVWAEDGVSKSWVRPEYLEPLDVRQIEDAYDSLDELDFDPEPELESVLESVTLDPRRVDAVHEAATVLRQASIFGAAPTPEAIVVLAGFLLGEVTPAEVYA